MEIDINHDGTTDTVIIEGQECGTPPVDLANVHDGIAENINSATELQESLMIGVTRHEVCYGSDLMKRGSAPGPVLTGANTKYYRPLRRDGKQLYIRVRR